TFLIANLGWRYSFVAAGGAGMLLSILWLLSVRDGGRVPRPAGGAHVAPATNWGSLLGNPNLRWLILGYAAIDYFQYIFVYWLYYYLGEVRKLPQADIAFYATMPFVAWFLMMPTGGWIADYLSARRGLKFGLRTVTITCLAMASICLIAALSAEDTNVLVALLSLALGFAAAADVPFWSAAVSLGGRQAGAAGGLMNTGGNLGGALAPILTPYLATHYGWSAGLYAGAAIAVIGVIAWLRIDPAPPAEAQAQQAAAV
ncbi:MAG: MFS transporter, partial [Bryobacterales bacterium]|nr:MFS transporter [Bryobacterales bacterium]